LVGVFVGAYDIFTVGVALLLELLLILELKSALLVNVGWIVEEIFSIVGESVIDFDGDELLFPLMLLLLVGL